MFKNSEIQEAMQHETKGTNEEQPLRFLLHAPTPSGRKASNKEETAEVAE